MSSLRFWICLIPAAVGTADLATFAAPQGGVVDAFLEQVRQSDAYPESAKQFLEKEWAAREQAVTRNTFIAEALAVLYPRFRLGLQAYEQQEYSFSAKIMGDLSLTSDRYLAVHAALFQAKAMVQEIQLEYAAMLLSHYMRPDFEVQRYTLMTDEMQFLLGYCEYHTFQTEAARQALETFLETYPEAAPELRTAAKQMLDDLRNPPRKNLDEVAHLMADAGLWITERETGVDTQTKQQKAIMILEELIRQAQRQEQQQQQQQGGGGQSARGTQVPASPAAESVAPEGAATQGTQHDLPRAAPGEVWGQLRPQERDKILQVLQQNFPSRYRELVEQYYSQLAKEQ